MYQEKRPLYRCNSLHQGIVHSYFTQEGCWGLMDEFHRVNVECLSVMLFEIQAVLLSMRGGLSTCTLEDGKEVSYFLLITADLITWTYLSNTPSATQATRWEDRPF